MEDTFEYCHVNAKTRLGTIKIVIPIDIIKFGTIAKNLNPSEFARRDARRPSASISIHFVTYLAVLFKL